MKKPKVEKYYLIVLPLNAEGGRALDLLRKDGPVQGVAYQGQAAVVASRSQIKKLTQAGLRWSYVKTSATKKRKAKAKPRARSSFPPASDR